MMYLIAFLIGFVTMGALWFVDDSRGEQYKQGYIDGVTETMRKIAALGEKEESE